jgi:hypothetical protein
MVSNTVIKKVQFVTPYKQLAGALIISQKRLKGNCELKNDSDGRYAAQKDPQFGQYVEGWR